MDDLTLAALIWGVSMSFGVVALGIICATLIMTPPKQDPAIRLKEWLEKKRQKDDG